MTQRFGRNQRRRAREAISDLQQEAARLTASQAMDRGLLQRQTRRLSDVESQLAFARELAGRMSVLFPATEEVSVTFKSTDHATVRVLPQEAALLDWAPSSQAIEASFVSPVDLTALIASIQHDQMARRVHAHIKFGDGVWAYGISQEAWSTMSSQQRFSLMRLEIADALANELAKFNPR